MVGVPDILQALLKIGRVFVGAARAVVARSERRDRAIMMSVELGTR